MIPNFHTVRVDGWRRISQCSECFALLWLGSAICSACGCEKLNTIKARNHYGWIVGTRVRTKIWRLLLVVFHLGGARWYQCKVETKPLDNDNVSPGDKNE